MGENNLFNPKDFMYIDENYPIDTTLPKHLLDYISELDGYYESDDWMSFDSLLDALEGTIKNYCIEGRITEKQLDTLFRRYGLR